MSILFLTLLTGLFLLMGQLALYDFLLLCGEMRQNLAVFSNPILIYPDYICEPVIGSLSQMELLRSASARAVPCGAVSV